MKYIILFAAVIILSMHVIGKQKHLVGYTPYVEYGADYLRRDTTIAAEDTCDYLEGDDFFYNNYAYKRAGFKETYKIF